MYCAVRFLAIVVIDVSWATDFVDLLCSCINHCTLIEVLGTSAQHIDCRRLSLENKVKKKEVSCFETHKFLIPLVQYLEESPQEE